MYAVIQAQLPAPWLKMIETDDPGFNDRLTVPKHFEMFKELMDVPQGDSDNSCLSWNTATADVDLDTTPAGDDRWADHTFEVELRTPTTAGGSLPAGYGDPRWFHVMATALVHVSFR